MSSFTYTEGSTQIQNGEINYLNDSIRLMLVTPFYPKNKSHASMSTPAAFEIQVGGYARRTLAGKTITPDTSNDRAVFSADDPAPWILAPGTEVGGAVVFRVFAGDSLSTPIWFLDFQDFPTNGSGFQILFKTVGIAYIEN